MKFTPEVIAALQTLKNAAENDFERHRISVLEKDLTAPPVVEQIDNTHQKFNGISYLQDHHNYYSYRNFIHRAVYSYYFGEIPDDYVIHHRDHNPANNDISNLQLITQIEHRQIQRFIVLIRVPLKQLQGHVANIL